MTVHVRGATQIKTLSAIRGIRSNERHVHQFQIASLELEHSRRRQERQAAMNRIKTLDGQLLEIEARIHKHQEKLSVLSASSSDDTHYANLMFKNKPTANEKRRTLRY